METTTEVQLSPEKIMQVGMGFFASKTLLAAIKLDLFTTIGDNELTGAEIKSKLGLHDRGLYDFLDALVSLGFLQRTGLKQTANYSNTTETGIFLDKKKPSYIGGILEMANDRLYPFWSNLEEGLKTGKPQNESKQTGTSPFEAIYADPDRLKQFTSAMAAIQIGNFNTLAAKFDFSEYSSVCDLGGANGALSIAIAQQHPQLLCISADLPEVEAVAKENVANAGLIEQIHCTALNFLTDELPKADVFTMGNVLHDWGTEHKKMLIQKAYAALPKNGALIIIENIIDDERNSNVFGLLMSLNMLIETSEGYDFSLADFSVWANEAGFKEIIKIHLTGPTSAIIAYK